MGKLNIEVFVFALSVDELNSGITVAARTAMMTTTMSSSTSVNPLEEHETASVPIPVIPCAIVVNRKIVFATTSNAMGGLRASSRASADLYIQI